MQLTLRRDPAAPVCFFIERIAYFGAPQFRRELRRIMVAVSIVSHALEWRWNERSNRQTPG